MAEEVSDMSDVHAHAHAHADEIVHTEQEVTCTSSFVSVKEMIQMYERVAEEVNIIQCVEQSVMTVDAHKHTGEPSQNTNIDVSVDIDIIQNKVDEPPQPVAVPHSKFHSFNRFLPTKTFF